MYTLQRLTGGVVFVFLAYHVGTTVVPKLWFGHHLFDAAPFLIDIMNDTFTTWTGTRPVREWNFRRKYSIWPLVIFPIWNLADTENPVSSSLFAVTGLRGSHQNKLKIRTFGSLYYVMEKLRKEMYRSRKNSWTWGRAAGRV